MTDSARIDVIDDATGLPTFASRFTLASGASRNVKIAAHVPGAIRQENDGRHYRLLIAKQADLENTEAAVTVRIPDGWKIETAKAAFRVTGSEVTVAAGEGSVIVRTPLEQDLLLDVTLSPK